MKFPEESRDLLINLDTKGCELTPTEIERVERMIDPLRGPLKKFPVATLYITIESFPRSNDYRVKTALRLSGRDLTTGDVDVQWYPALERCTSKLKFRLLAYEAEMSEEEDRHKHLQGTRHEVLADHAVDPAAVDKAVEDQDYNEFRKQLFVYEESLRKRAGRWIQRYPLLEAQLGDGFDLADVVEEVFLMAFDRYEHRPQGVRFGDWLEGLIDPALKLLVHASDQELENIDFARSMRDIE